MYDIFIIHGQIMLKQEISAQQRIILMGRILPALFAFILGTVIQRPAEPTARPETK